MWRILSTPLTDKSPWTIGETGAYTGIVVNPIPADWLAEFEAAARRPLKLRWRYAFIKTYKPVLDDAEYRSFDTMEDYRRWCEENLPDWLGYGGVRVSAG